MTKLNNIINSDMLNSLLDKKINDFQLFIVRDKNKQKLIFSDKKSGCEIEIAEFTSYTKYVRWLTEAAIMRASANPASVRKVRQMYKNLFNFARDSNRNIKF